MSRPEPDPVARWLAGIVRRCLMTGQAGPLPEGVTAVEVHAVGELDTGVAVTTADRVRYFLVRVAEFDHR